MAEWEDWAKDGSAWEEADEVAASSGGGAYVSLKDGDKVQVVFRGRPHAFETVWLGNRSEIYDPDKHDGERPKARFLFSVSYRKGNKGKYTPGLFEASATTYATIKKALSKHGSKHVYELEREGNDMNTTKYHCLYEKSLEGKELEHIASLDVLDPVEAVEAKKDGGSGPAPTDLPEAGDPFGEDIPF